MSGTSSYLTWTRSSSAYCSTTTNITHLLSFLWGSSISICKLTSQSSLRWRLLHYILFFLGTCLFVIIRILIVGENCRHTCLLNWRCWHVQIQYLGTRVLSKTLIHHLSGTIQGFIWTNHKIDILLAFFSRGYTAWLFCSNKFSLMGTHTRTGPLLRLRWHAITYIVKWIRRLILIAISIANLAEWIVLVLVVLLISCCCCLDTSTIGCLTSAGKSFTFRILLLWIAVRSTKTIWMGSVVLAVALLRCFDIAGRRSRLCSSVLVVRSRGRWPWSSKFIIRSALTSVALCTFGSLKQILLTWVIIEMISTIVHCKRRSTIVRLV